MPAGGANAGGSMQIGFEMELITASTVRELFRGWPNYQTIRRGHTWEARSMEQCESALCFEVLPAGWGVGNAKLAPLKSGCSQHLAVLMVGPPLTVTWRLREDTTTSLTIRAPLVIYTQADAILLPPDDADGTPFFQDPMGQEGMHRDLFRTHARKIVTRFVDQGFPLTPALRRLGI